MPAVSKAQQRFMGMVYAVKKGEMSSPSSEVAKAAASMSKKDAKDFASTKHKKLPEKKVAKEAYYGGEEQRKKDEKKKKIDAFMDKAMPKRTFDQLGRETDRRTGKLKEGWSDKYKKSIDCNNPKGFSQRAHCQGKKKVSESTKYDKYDKEKKEFAKSDRKMKFGKFYDRAKQSKLRPGEVKRYDKELGRYVSNKE